MNDPLNRMIVMVNCSLSVAGGVPTGYVSARVVTLSLGCGSRRRGVGRGLGSATIMICDWAVV